MTGRYDNIGESSSSSLNSSQQDPEDDMTIASILSEEHMQVDGTLKKHLSHLDSIPHTPRVNGAIPDVDDATLDHERLLERLTTYGLAELQIEGDGNCQFRALADQLFCTPEYHKHVRKQIVKQLKHFRVSYEGYVPMEYKSYLKKMKRFGIQDLGSGAITLPFKQLQTGLGPKFVYLHLLEILATSKLFPRKKTLQENFG